MLVKSNLKVLRTRRHHERDTRQRLCILKARIRQPKVRTDQVPRG